MRLGSNERHEQERSMRIRTFTAATVAAGVFASAVPAAGASALTGPTASAAPSPSLPAFTFVPPKVGQLSVDIGPTIINGKVIDPGLHVLSPGVTVPPISWTLPSTGPTRHR
jgi:hypothetical protein